MSRFARSASIVLAAFLLQTGPGLAETCDDNCSGLFIFEQATTQSTLQKSRMVSGIVGNRLAPGPAAGSTPGAPLQYAPSAETGDPAAQAINGEAYSLATNDPAMNWNAWFDASMLYADRNNPVVSFEGPLFTASIGVDRAVGEASVIGLLVNYEHFDYNTGFSPGSYLKGDGFGIGAYAGSAITDHIVADAMVIWSFIDNDVNEFVVNSFDSNRIQAAANLTGYWYRDAWRLSPTLGLTYTYENQDPYPGTPRRKLDSAIAIAGFQIGHTTFLDDVRTIEPWVGVNAEWEFHSSDVTSFGTDPNLDPFDFRILGGVNAQMSQAVSGSLRADIAGLARDGYLTGTVGGQIAVRF
jgi:outer membrane autotransporter protein